MTELICTCCTNNNDIVAYDGDIWVCKECFMDSLEKEKLSSALNK